MEELIANGADPTVKTKDQQTLLMLGASSGSAPMVRFILQQDLV